MLQKPDVLFNLSQLPLECLLPLHLSRGVQGEGELLVRSVHCRPLSLQVTKQLLPLLFAHLSDMSIMFLQMHKLSNRILCGQLQPHISALFALYMHSQRQSGALHWVA